MARPRVADGVGGLHMWRVTANILNSRGQPTEGGVFLLVAWRGIDRHCTKFVLRNAIMGVKLGVLP
jgi:hypothetical protein